MIHVCRACLQRPQAAGLAVRRCPQRPQPSRLAVSRATQQPGAGQLRKPLAQLAHTLPRVRHLAHRGACQAAPALATVGPVASKMGERKSESLGSTVPAMAMAGMTLPSTGQARTERPQVLRTRRQPIALQCAWVASPRCSRPRPGRVSATAPTVTPGQGAPSITPSQAIQSMAIAKGVPRQPSHEAK